MALNLLSALVLPLVLSLTTTPFVDAPTVFDEADVLTSSQEELLSTFLDELPNVQPHVEFLDTLDGLSEDEWLASKAVQFRTEEPGSNVIYLGVSMLDRGMWFILGDGIQERVSEADLTDIYSLYMVDDFKNGYYGYGSAAGIQAVYDVYSGLGVADSQFLGFPASEPVLEPEPSKPLVEEPEPMAVAPVEEQRAPTSTGPDPIAAMAPVLAISLIGLTVIAIIISFIGKAVRSVRAKKLAALKAIEDKRIKRLVDDLVHKLKRDDDFFSATPAQQAEAINKAAFGVFSLKEADKALVIAEATAQLLQLPALVSS